MSDLLDLYQTLIVEHSRHPHHRGTLDGDAVRHAEGDNPLCGDHVTVYLRVEDDRIVDVTFDGDGCAISVASASMMCDAVVGRTVDEANELFTDVHDMVVGASAQGGAGEVRHRAEVDDEDDALDASLDALGPLAALSGVRRFPMRVKCATLAWHTLRSALGARAAVLALLLVVGSGALAGCAAERATDVAAPAGGAAADALTSGDASTAAQATAGATAGGADSAAGGVATGGPAAAQPAGPSAAGPSAAVSDAIAAALPTVDDHGDAAAFQAIQAAQRKLLTEPAFRIRQSTTTAQQTFPMTLTFKAPDRFSMVTPQLMAVRLGERGYAKIGGQWLKDDNVVPSLKAAFDALRDPATVDRTLASVIDARSLGTSTVNDVPARHYGYRTVARTASTIFTSTFEIWVGAADGRPIVQQVKTEASGATSATAQLIDYGPGLEIEVPPEGVR
ncbi:MAG: Fe-S cluster assembly sulfur transfer protein SufU [Ardenticatenales bacterium]